MAGAEVELQQTMLITHEDAAVGRQGASGRTHVGEFIVSISMQVVAIPRRQCPVVDKPHHAAIVLDDVFHGQRLRLALQVAERLISQRR